jgi:hypothetical protein
VKALIVYEHGSDPRGPDASVTIYGNIKARGQISARWPCLHHVERRSSTVHVYRDGKLVVKWDLDNQLPMKGAAKRRVLQLIAELEAEGVL